MILPLEFITAPTSNGLRATFGERTVIVAEGTETAIRA
jgi:hypothetical protein